ncbi:hypothetical protein DLM78_04150 [Leptospira stimsonii]|uniref:Uncharacterized protein n=1 Tax=Leptospira stimsonii TaxID=2202203 RepID=A0A8B3CVA1_9LEPT|nr:hypothetical protein DLM78_04150 [Leptospira stimsonii]
MQVNANSLNRLGVANPNVYSEAPLRELHFFYKKQCDFFEYISSSRRWNVFAKSFLRCSDCVSFCSGHLIGKKTKRELHRDSQYRRLPVKAAKEIVSEKILLLNL